MVFARPDFSEAMKEDGRTGGRDIGYAFALPRLIAYLCGRHPRRAELSRWEAYGLGILVFGISGVFMGRALLPVVRPGFVQLLVLVLLPFAVWTAFLLLYYVNSLVIALLRRLGLFSARNNQFQHFVIMFLTTLLAALLTLDEIVWIRWLGIIWFGLVSLNLVSILIFPLLHES
jgi:hypothetical protein